MPMVGKKKDLKSEDLSFLLKKLEKEEQIKCKVGKREETKSRAEINEIENKNNEVNEHKSIFLEEINKIDKLLARLS